MPPKRMNLDQALAQVIGDDDEDMDESDYNNESDFETENDVESGESEGAESSDDSDVHDDNVVRPGLAVQRPANRGCGGRGRGRGRFVPPPMNIPAPWRMDTNGYTAQQFRPNHPPGPRNIPDNINAESGPLDFFSLFWDDVLWELLVTETNRNAANVKAAKPNNYVAKMGKKEEDYNYTILKVD